MFLLSYVVFIPDWIFGLGSIRIQCSFRHKGYLQLILQSVLWECGNVQKMDTSLCNVVPNSKLMSSPHRWRRRDRTGLSRRVCVSRINWIRDNSRLSLTENFETEHVQNMRTVLSHCVCVGGVNWVRRSPTFLNCSDQISIMWLELVIN